MAITHEGPAPYAPTANVLRAIDHYREKAPAAISKELLMRLGYPDSYANRTLRALRMLDLISEEGTPTDALKELQRASDEEFVARLQQVVRTGYAEVFEAVDPATASVSQIETAFRFYSPQAQRDKMVALFMGLCDAAGILPPEKAPPRRTMRVVKDGAAPRKPSGDESTGRSPLGSGPKTVEREKVDPPKPPVATDKAALKTRYIEVLIEKAAASDDDKLLDRIEALLREDEQKD